MLVLSPGKKRTSNSWTRFVLVFIILDYIYNSFWKCRTEVNGRRHSWRICSLISCVCPTPVCLPMRQESVNFLHKVPNHVCEEKARNKEDTREEKESTRFVYHISAKELYRQESKISWNDTKAEDSVTLVIRILVAVKIYRMQPTTTIKYPPK